MSRDAIVPKDEGYAGAFPARTTECSPCILTFHIFKYSLAVFLFLLSLAFISMI